MYTDPSLIRDIVLRVRLSEQEDNLLNAITEYTGQQKSTLMRELFIEQAKLVLAGLGDVQATPQLFEAPERAALNQR